LVDECGGSDESAEDLGPVAVARLARLAPFTKNADRVEQCAVEPCVVNEVAPEVARRLSSAERPEHRIDRLRSSAVLLVWYKLSPRAG
jgi:hypothetical protein